MLRSFRVIAAIPDRDPPQASREAILGVNFLVENGFRASLAFAKLELETTTDTYRAKSARDCGLLIHKNNLPPDPPPEP